VLGGLAILVGALVALVGIPLIVSMLVAMFTVQLRRRRRAGEGRA
jgi:uncharacterized membrane protein YphA (DoxX/SURF4 family)